ncbi:MAG: hydroxymethylpyrimidine/phosphomethylpyrimidine kinase [Myxococcota bacterium]|jgi:hydroxymethylpyrimidine/phosphomethylpyrimidine kinase
MRNPLRPVTILCVGGNDAGMGAGLETDFAVAKALGCHAHLAPTMHTVQTVDGLQSVELIDREVVGRSMLEALSDGIDAVKVGALGDALITEVVIEVLDPWQKMLPIVFDPVASASKSKHGVFLNTAAGVKLAEERLLPMVTLATPNAIEYGSGKSYLECAAILRKGGHADPFAVFESGEHPDYISDVLEARGRPALEFRHTRLDNIGAVHGTGCALSSLVTCYLAMNLDLENAVTTALRVMQEWLRAAEGGDGGLRPQAPDIVPGTRMPDPRDGDGFIWL